MKMFLFLVVNLVVSSAFAQNQNGMEIVEIGEEKDITEANKDLLHDDIMEFPNTQRSATLSKSRLWTSPVPYVLDKDLEMNAKGVVLRAFDQFRLKSCIDFKPRDSEKYYISVQKLGGCFSYVGRLQARQTLSIGRFCDAISTVEHEFLHALGFYHEQSRYDRDDYVIIAVKNIEEGKENNFRKVDEKLSTTQGVPYDYWSVMHYGPNAFSNGNGSTIITKNPQFQDVIGQRLEMSARDVQELNLLYKCNSTVAFQMYCGFTNRSMCQMKTCSRSGIFWEMVTQRKGGPTSDHTNLPSGGHNKSDDTGYFMHASTAWRKEGDSARLETQKMRPNRACHIQCLQFYYYHSGSESDHLNIWIREFRDEWDSMGTLRLMQQITGPPTTHWQLQHVSLNATRLFQVEFEVRKGAGSSSGGISIDDINLSEVECPHVTLQIDDFEERLKSSSYGESVSSPRHYSRGGYAYAVGVQFSRSYFGLFVQLLSGDNDDKLEWPCPHRQATFQMVDQNPNIQLQMSKQRSITSDLSKSSDGTFKWGNPREVGSPFVDDNNETIYGGPLLGKRYFSFPEEMKSRHFLKGGSAVFTFSFQDIRPLVSGSALPCAQLGPVKIVHAPLPGDNGPCTQILTTTPSPTTTTSKTPFTTTSNTPFTTTSNTPFTTTSNTPFTNTTGITIIPPVKTTDDGSIFGFSPGLASSSVLVLLSALLGLTP